MRLEIGCPECPKLKSWLRQRGLVELLLQASHLQTLAPEQTLLLQHAQEGGSHRSRCHSVASGGSHVKRQGGKREIQPHESERESAGEREGYGSHGETCEVGGDGVETAFDVFANSDMGRLEQLGQSLNE